MASIAAKPTIELKVLIELGEEEVRALDALVGYGDDQFLTVFKEKLGEYYIRDHEQGLRSFFKSMREKIPGIIERTDNARNLFEGKKTLQ
jgi:hypothetical protein